MLIGVISDTHGWLRPEVFEHFENVDRIIHAGDIGSADVLQELESLAPVQAVYGNVDRFPLIERLPDRLFLNLEKVPIFVTHIGGKPKEIQDRYPDAKDAKIVIFGHSHRALKAEHAGILYFNPGSAGPQRFGLSPTVGKILVRDGSIVKAEILELLH